MVAKPKVAFRHWQGRGVHVQGPLIDGGVQSKMECLGNARWDETLID